MRAELPPRARQHDTATIRRKLIAIPARNRIAHGYLLVEPAIMRSTVDRDLPAMVTAVRAAIDRLP